MMAAGRVREARVGPVCTEQIFFIISGPTRRSRNRKISHRSEVRKKQLYCHWTQHNDILFCSISGIVKIFKRATKFSAAVKKNIRIEFIYMNVAYIRKERLF